MLFKSKRWFKKCRKHAHKRKFSIYRLIGAPEKRLSKNAPNKATTRLFGVLFSAQKSIHRQNVKEPENFNFKTDESIIAKRIKTRKKDAVLIPFISLSFAGYKFFTLSVHF